jgi:hypothetical protein
MAGESDFGFDSVTALYERICERRRRREKYRIPSITCPDCDRTSWNPDDVREGYCGNCHDWTTPRALSNLWNVRVPC